MTRAFFKVFILQWYAISMQESVFHGRFMPGFLGKWRMFGILTFRISIENEASDNTGLELVVIILIMGPVS